jgi:hypothetical protein
MSIDTLRVAVAVLPTESFTCTPNVAVPAAGVAPESTPPLDRVSATAVSSPAFEVTVQLYPVPEPPLAVSVCEYAVPA